MRRCLAAMLLLVACSYEHGETGGGSGSMQPIDAALDTPGDVPAMACYGTMLAQVCFAVPPQQPVAITALRTIDTTIGSADCAPQVGANPNRYCAIAGSSMMITAPISVR